MILHDILRSNHSFQFGKNIYYQKDLPCNDTFEKKYIELREIEKRVYPDEIVRNLPDYMGILQLEEEWFIRKITMNKVIKYFEVKGNNKLVLELGCGNGWLSHQLASSLNAEVLGMDINETELLQGASLFKECENLTFMRADVFSVDLKKKSFDTILLASSIQYFPNLTKLINRLLELLNPSGEIHIVDSPIYSSAAESREAKKRSDDYFNVQAVPEMANNYFHHCMNALENFQYRVLYKPNYLFQLFKTKISRTPNSPFPWIVIKHY